METERDRNERGSTRIEANRQSGKPCEFIKQPESRVFYRAGL